MEATEQPSVRCAAFAQWLALQPKNGATGNPVVRITFTSESLGRADALSEIAAYDELGVVVKPTGQITERGRFIPWGAIVQIV